MRAERSCARLVFELLAFGAAVQNVDIVRRRAVQGFIAWQPLEAARGIAAFDGAAYFPGVRLEHRSSRSVPGLNPTYLGVHVAACAERGRAMRGWVPGGSWGWVGPSQRGQVGSSAVLAVPCPWRGLFHRRRRRPNPHRGCPVAVPGAAPVAVQGVVLGAVQGPGLVERSWALHLRPGCRATPRHQKCLPMGGPFLCPVC